MRTIIDAHQHFWKYHPQTHSWIDDSMKIIRHDFMPNDLSPILKENNVSGCVAVQADQTEEETEFLISLANENDYIKGVVGWVDLQEKNITERLAYFNEFSVVKGFRHIVQGQPEGFMLQTKFLNGISALKNFGFKYDILIYPNQLSEALELVKRNPEQLFVIDHLAKPYIKAGLIKEWKKDITAIAENDNVFCKISGLVTEANHETWTQEQLKPYLDIATEVFGTKRIMFGSDWPVCLVASTYEKLIFTIQDYYKSFSQQEQEDIFSLNAKAFYHIK